MSEFVEWMAAQGDEGEHVRMLQPGKGQPQEEVPGKPALQWQNLPVHNFPTRLEKNAEEQLYNDALERNPDLWLYRERTLALLRRYMRFSLETGRLPSFVGQEFFRARVTSYRAVTFEDRVIFVSDVETCLHQLHPWDQQLVARIVLQEYSYDQAVHILHCCRKTIQRRLPEVLDLLSEIFLKVGLLIALPSRTRPRD